MKPSLLLSSPSSDTALKLESLASSVHGCTLCELSCHRTNAVPGFGNPSASIVFIGEAPGKKEDETGMPFCGASGNLLDSLLSTINLKRENIFITNIVKCRPPSNRDPLPQEKRICADTYLGEQLAIINPKIIITLGRHAFNHFFPDLKISEMHGKPLEQEGKIFLPLYHPAVALYNPSMREVLSQDFRIIPSLLKNKIS